MPDTLTKLTYQTFQQSKSIFGLAHKTLSRELMKALSPVDKKVTPVPTELLPKLQERLNNLLETDWEDAEGGVYPKSLLFDNPWQDFFVYYPQIWMDLPLIWERAKSEKYQDFAPNIDTTDYPQYYVRNFHYQTDGYLSESSANLYDLGVELLFNGAADAMRRRILAPLKAGLKIFADVSPRQQRVLDIACGTGRTLKMIRATLPYCSLFGADLSPTYLRKANQLLSEIPGELPQLLQTNAEELPYLDDYFHATTCVFLFHELPAAIRQRVINEAFRVTKPGGTFIICDSVQLSDWPEVEPVMQNFQESFYEPFYMNYVADNLVERLETAGFENIEIQVHHMSKYWIARKPLM